MLKKNSVHRPRNVDINRLPLSVGLVQLTVNGSLVWGRTIIIIFQLPPLPSQPDECLLHGPVLSNIDRNPRRRLFLASWVGRTCSAAQVIAAPPATCPAFGSGSPSSPTPSSTRVESFRAVDSASAGGGGGGGGGGGCRGRGGGGHVYHPVQGVLCAEFPFFLLKTACVPFPFSLINRPMALPRVNKNHPLRGVRAAKLACLAFVGAEPRSLRATLVGSTSRCERCPSLFGVTGADLGSRATLQGDHRTDHARGFGTGICFWSLTRPFLDCLKQISGNLVPFTPHSAGTV